MCGMVTYFLLSQLVVVAQGDARITVWLLDYADVPQATLMVAERQASRIFQGAGVAAEWLDCPTSRYSGASACEELMHPVELVIKVLPGKMMQYLDPPGGTLAFILQPGMEKFATSAYVCYSCVNELAIIKGGLGGRRDWISAILGSVLAHELGHLLGIPGHTIFGLMHTPWNLEELTLAQQGGLLFTQEEGRQIRAHLHRRIIAAPHAHLGTDAALVALGQVSKTDPGAQQCLREGSLPD